MRRLIRFVSVFVHMGPFLLAFLRDRRSWILFGRSKKRTAQHHLDRAERLTARLANLGPTFVKLAQLLSARADILPEPYLTEVSRLQDQVPSDPLPRITAVIEAELEAPIGEIFQDFGEEPIATASLGQVHRARVSGRDVVVKILRPGVEAAVALDLDISFQLMFWLNILFPNHHVRSLTNVIREFSVRVRAEMDFRIEAQNIVRFQEVF
ncbi:uncharacterized protein METZ01_LOCUS509347, partial [marine metagenome]